MKARAFTLMEIIVVIVILILLTLLIFPILSSVKKSARVSESTLHLRQIHLALVLYKEDTGEYPLENLDVLVDSGFLKDKRILHIPTDPVSPGFANRLYECNQDSGYVPLKYPTSYEDVFNATLEPTGDHSQLYLSMIRTHDNNPGIVATRIFGERYAFSAASCAGLTTGFDGFVLRLREDGSVQHARYRDVQPDGQRRYCWPGVFTDVSPDIICNRK